MTATKRITELLISNCPVSFIASVDAEGFPNMKALLPPRKMIGIQTFYFITTRSSLRVAQFRENPKSSIYCCDQRHYVGVMLKGTVEVLEDPKSKKMLWLETDTVYYKGDLSDPEYCVLRFTAIAGRLYRDFRATDFAI